LQQKLDDALKVTQRAGGIDYPRHRTALGRRGFSPRAFAAR
jgi:hypothetical protein